MQRRKKRHSLGVVWALLAMLVLSSCATDWATWGYGTQRQGFNPAESIISPSNVSTLRQKWASADLGAYINTSPIVAINLTVNGTKTDVIYVGTEHGDLVALNPAGQVLWTKHLGTQTRTDCLDQPDGIYGITGSPVFDRASNRLFVADSAGHLYAVNAATGATLPGWPVTFTTNPAAEFTSSALTLSGSNLYLVLASHCDAGAYKGRVVRIDTTTRAINAFYLQGGPTGPNGAGVWGWGGASVDAGGAVYVATGNTFANPENAYYGDAIVRLTSNLGFVSSHSPGFGFGDDDFGSTPVLFQKNGCPRQLLAEQKSGGLYLYDRDSIASGFRQRVRVTTQDFIGLPAYSPVTQMVYVVNPVPYGFFGEGLLAFRLDANCKLQLAWQSSSPVALGSTPTVANGVVYYADGFTPGIHAVNASTGRRLWSSGALTAPVVAAPVVVNGRLYAVSWDHKVHAYGLP